MEHLDDIERLIDYIESAGIVAGALMETYANEREMNKAIIFEAHRDILNASVYSLKSFISINQKHEK